jgi:hypothetical protein
MKRAARQRQPSRGLIQEPDARRVQLIRFGRFEAPAVGEGVEYAKEEQRAAGAVRRRNCKLGARENGAPVGVEFAKRWGSLGAVSGCEDPQFSGARWAKSGAAVMPSGGPPGGIRARRCRSDWATAATSVAAVRMNGQAGGCGRRSRLFGHGALHGEWPTDAEMAKPVAGSDDRSSVLEPLCLTTVDSRSR